MAYEHKLNAGSLFVNNRKTKDTHPDRSGTINVAGVVYYIDGWLKQDKNGNPWLSLSVKPIASAPATRTEPPVTPKDKLPGGFEQMDSDIPFSPIGKGISGHAI